jgi:hypothetical protein
MPFINNRRGKTLDGTREVTNADVRSKTSETSNLTASDPPIKLIPWADIWTSLRIAKIRGNGEMIEAFYDTLFKEAVFDDSGAWAVDIKNRF